MREKEGLRARVLAWLRALREELADRYDAREADEFVIPDGLHLLIRDRVMHEAGAAQKNATVPVHRACSLYHAWSWSWSAALPLSRSA